MIDMTHRAFFGDAEYNFCIAPELIVELERKCGAGIGGLCRRLFAGDFKHADVTETIRLALVGGGMSPQNADALIAAYAVNRPLSEIYPLAVSILEALWFGVAKKGEGDAAA
jgi:Phage tail tube protein, GTA-gp10